MAKNNWLICGTSPFAVSGFKGNYKLIDRGIDFSKFITIALNWFPIKCNYRCIVDHRTIDYTYKYGEKLIICNQLLPELRYFNKGREGLKIKPHYVFEIGKELDCVNSVCEPAIEYAYKQGADNIILYGVDLKDDFQPKEKTDVTRSIIELYPNIFTMNKDTGVNVPLWVE